MSFYNTYFPGYLSEVTFISHLEAALLDMIHNQQSLKGEQDSNPWQWTGMLWAVPKHRRTLQVRKTRRRAQERLFKRTDDLVACETCGHHRRIGFLCS